jgi:hypothetical protein
MKSSVVVANHGNQGAVAFVAHQLVLIRELSAAVKTSAPRETGPKH